MGVEKLGRKICCCCCCYYICLYVDLCQITDSDKMELSPGPQNLLVVFSTNGQLNNEIIKNIQKMDYLAAA